MTISNKQQLLKLLQSADIKQVAAKDIHAPIDLDEFKKIALNLMRTGAITVFVVAS
jgi:hypothetical protein